ncbi:extracellular solute-binding protein [Mesorhizobium sp. Z1-4]|uniref:extracellular solute-binding protein n=1 Tax=Mesorhizobium sp. Z1-4 TaxID=2448478 RepID=UPI000FDB5D3F|nr:extracellular solute-binding protein [Mesorhizobium sp. Z1-4]
MKLRLLLAATTAAFVGYSASASAETKIQWWHAMGGQLGETVNQIAADFNASQNEVEITPVYKGTYEETLTAGIAAFRAGGQPNILQVFDAGAATVIGAKGAVLPVQDLLEGAGADFNIEDYISGVRYFYADSAGKMIGMPFNSSAPIMYYNTEALEKAGVEAPTTWEEFEAIAPKLKEAGYIALVQSHLPWEFTENFLSRNNLQFATNNNGYDGAVDTKLLVNAEPLKMMFTKLSDWKKEGFFEWYGTGWGDNQTPFEQGKVALWVGSSGSFGGLQKSATMPFGAVPLPCWASIVGEGGCYQSFIGGAALFAMSGKSDEENAATAKFFEYMTSPEVQLMWHKETGYVPITNAAYEAAKSEGYYDETPQAEVGIEQLNMKAGEWTRGYRMGFYVQIRDIMNREYGKLFTGETTVDAAFEAIESEGNQLLERFAKTGS